MNDFKLKVQETVVGVLVMGSTEKRVSLKGDDLSLEDYLPRLALCVHVCFKLCHICGDRG